MMLFPYGNSPALVVLMSATHLINRFVFRLTPSADDTRVLWL
jgi:hypothetical protein